MKEGHQNLVEEHKNNNVNLFKKVLITTKRAKSLYSLEESARFSLKHKPTFQAIMENNQGQVIMKSSIPSIDENDDGPE
ncbi:MAG: DNA-directed RNA polymerase subunit omega [SAR324 cluster bacterium]|nr:DNA-directed RNA polymerase subunit omega [SAR324 cluster bacterium]|tara:strand:- start:698 stop:934 length:237 start_codon:yes stop_codon:yes gene_type:complete